MDIKNDKLNLDDAAAADQFLHSGLRRLPTWEDYRQLATESKYATWLFCTRRVVAEPVGRCTA